MLTIDGIIFTLQKSGGISVIFKQLLQFLENSNIPTMHILDGKNLHEPFKFKDGVETIYRNARNFERYRSCRMLNEKQNSTAKNCDIFHSSYYRIPTDKKVSTVVTVHDFMYEHFRRGPAKWIHSQQKNRAIQRAQSIICVSESTLDDLVNFVNIRGDQKLHVIHNGASECFQPIAKFDCSKLASERPFFLFVGLRNGYKNFHLALKALDYLPDFELKCVGGGAFGPDELNNYSDSVTSRIKHLGFVTDFELNYLYNTAACLLYPSSYEGFGIPVIEAMKAGCPVVSINCKAILEIGGDALVMASEEDPKLIASAILETVSSNRQKIIREGLLNAQKYSWERTFTKTIEVYRDLGLQ